MSSSSVRGALVLATALAAFGLPAVVRAGPPPANDDFQRASAITAPVSWITRLDLATREPGEPLHGGQVTVGTVWFTFTPTYTRRVAVVVNPADVGTVVAVYSGSELADLRPVGVTPLAGTRPAPYVAWIARAGQTYRIAVGLLTPDLTFEPWLPVRLLLLDPRPLAPNDDFGKATPISLPFREQGNLLETSFGMDPGNVGPKSVWFKLRSPRTLGVTVAAAPVGPVELTCHPDDVFIYAFTGDRAAKLRQVGDWFGGEGSGRYRFVARAGVLYHLAISCPFALDYRIAVTGRRLAGVTLQVHPAWKAEFLRARVRDEVAWLRRPQGTLPVELATWSPARVRVALWRGAALIAGPLEVTVRRDAPAWLRLRLTPAARRALRGVTRLDAALRVAVVGSDDPRDARTLPVHLHVQRLPSLG